MTAVLIEHTKVSELPESWRALPAVECDVRVTVRIEEESASAQDGGSAFGMWSDRDDLTEVAGYVRRLRAPRVARDE